MRGGAGLVFMLLVLISGLLVAHFIVTPVEMVKQQIAAKGGAADDAALVDELVDAVRPVVVWAIGGRGGGESPEEDAAAQRRAEAWAQYLLDDRPALLSGILMILLFAHPMLLCVGAFNQLSGDIQTRGLRYQLLHTDRANIYFGRFLGTTAYAILVKALLVATITLYIGAKLRIHPWGELIEWSLLGLLALAILTPPYVALCTWISGAIDAPMGSLAVSTLVVGGVPLFALLGGMTWAPAGALRHLLPWGVQNDLLHHEPARVALAALACLGYTVVFLALGYRQFAKRDL